MSKEIFLYSEDKKYKCAVELADSLDKFNCPDHSVMILFEERDNGTYIIAQARDKRLETEKDTIIDDLQMHNADFMIELADAKNKIADLEAKLAGSKENCFDLQQRLADKEEQCRECKHLNKKIELNIKNKLLIENEQLKQQLAEKDDTLETHKRVIQRMNRNCDTTMCRNKISFAVAELEKLKEEFNGVFSISIQQAMLDNYIDNQIEQLKEMK